MLSVLCGTTGHFFTRSLGGPGTVRLPPSRAQRASASLAEAFGKGGKPDTTYCRRVKDGLIPKSCRPTQARGQLAVDRARLCQSPERIGVAGGSTQIEVQVAAVAKSMRSVPNRSTSAAGKRSGSNTSVPT